MAGRLFSMFLRYGDKIMENEPNQVNEFLLEDAESGERFKFQAELR